jgi:hypothetical protein
VATLVAHLAGNAALRLNHPNQGWYSGTLSAVTPLLVVATVVALAAAGIVAGRNLRAEDLRRE